jgi:hypothetical protein
MLLFNQIDFIDNKVLTKEYFGKFFIRSLNIENENIYVLDNNSVQFNSNLCDLNKFIFTSKLKLGRSFQVETYDYKNKFNDSIKFNSYILTKKNFSINYTQTFLKSIQLISKNSNSLKFLFLTNPNKGGFICYSYGFLGFIPRTHCNYFLIKILKFFKRTIIKKNNLTFYLNIFKKELYFFNFYTKYFIFNLNSVYTLNKFLIKLKFNNKKNFKKLYKKYKLNFVFLIKN